MNKRTAALLIDDDAKLASLVAEYLGQNEVDVTVAGDGERGLAALKKGHFDVVLLDIMLPGVDGLEVCRRIRGLPDRGNTPVLMLTAKGDDVDKIVGLELGADDYMAKPFNPRELLARVRAILRRAQPPSGAEGHQTFSSSGLTIDFDAREVTVDGKR
ncbi:MAG: response regulator transcription factor, partial [Polyangia bacterium]